MKAVTAPASGETTLEGAPPSSASMRAAPALAPLHEAIDHDQTSVMPIAQAQALAKSEGSDSFTPGGESHEAEEDDLRQTMRRDADDRVTSTGGESSEPQTAEAITGEAPTEEPELPLAIGVRVRIFASETAVVVVPEGMGGDGGIAAILVPQDASVDLRAVFVKK
jgi:hypothetical protein